MKLTDPFDEPSHQIPSHPIPSHQTRAPRSLCKSCIDPGRSGKHWSGKAPIQYMQVQTGFNFTKAIPLNKFFEKLKLLLKKVKWGQFHKRNPLKRKFLKKSKFCSNWKTKVQKRSVVVGVFETTYVQDDFSKTNFHIKVLILKSKLPNLTSNF